MSDETQNTVDATDRSAGLEERAGDVGADQVERATGEEGITTEEVALIGAASAAGAVAASAILNGNQQEANLANSMSRAEGADLADGISFDEDAGNEVGGSGNVARTAELAAALAEGADIGRG